MTRRAWFFTTYFATVAIGISAAIHVSPRLIWNETASVPTGLYRLRPGSALHVGDIVAIRLPEQQALLLSERGYLPFGVPLLKPVAALPGQTVCRSGNSVTVDGNLVGEARAADHRGRVLPVWQGCQHLVAGQVFVMNPAVQASLDGRYFGPLPADSVLGRAIPLWITTGDPEPPPPEPLFMPSRSFAPRHESPIE
ncbi:S26 family signal peptidase [Gluconacetobacter entanii]|uniref:Conjugal transfer protein TraF n=1 Tax=Gluconacetobacter entanii TaxID=108528 RepID=A0A318PR41_9PROT|nr:S26 family signal peptidase [Gluconacetobacter entanii]PYD62384.1 conjugal transfer protein TraF [Gluconacetobacter entanii]